MPAKDSVENQIPLRPVRLSRVDEIREHLVRLGITEDDIPAAIKWAREVNPNPSEVVEAP